MTEDRDRDRVVALGTGARTAYERDTTIDQLFALQASRSPSRTAVASEEGTLTYAQLDLAANRLATWLNRHGVRPGAAVGVALERSIEVPVILLGILKAGCIYVPLDVSYPRERLAFIAGDASISCIVTERRASERLPNTSALVLLIDEHAGEIGTQRATSPPAAHGADAIAYVMYTSGSTGRPKGVAIPHRGVVRLVRGADYVTIAHRDVFLHFAPLAFDASTFEIWAPLLNGACLAIAPAGQLSLAELGHVLERFAVTTLWLTAPLFRLMVETELRRLGGLRQLLTGGDVVSVQHAISFLKAFPACRLIDGYGPTENTTFSCCYPIPSPDAIRAAVPIGRPIANSTAYALDENLRPAPIGTPGELCVGGDGIARGYVNLPALTAERFVPNPFSREPGARLYRTGDRARLRPDGVFEFLGRVDHQVKVHGFRIELGEIESVLRSHPDLIDAAVTVVTRGGENMLFAHVVTAPGGRADEIDLRRHLAEKLPRHMIPTHIAGVKRLPEHSSGKLDRVTLAEHAATILRQSPLSGDGIGCDFSLG